MKLRSVTRVVPTAVSSGCSIFSLFPLSEVIEIVLELEAKILKDLLLKLYLLGSEPEAP